MEKRRLMAEVTPQTPNCYLLSIIYYLFLLHGADFVNILQKMSTSVNIYLYEVNIYLYEVNIYLYEVNI